MRAVALLTVLSCLAPAAPARAQRPGADTGWSELFHPARRQARQRVRQGLALLATALNRLDPNLGDDPRHVLLDRALARFTVAQRTLPEDTELAYYVAWALTEWQQPNQYGGTDFRSEEAVGAWHRVRALDPSFMPEQVAANLAMLHMRRQELDRARAEYEAALAVAATPPVTLFFQFYVPSGPEFALDQLFATLDLPSVHGNLAEALMLGGDVRGAERHYRAALETTQSPASRVLAEWGLALTLERSGDHDAALEWAERAIREDPIDPDGRYAHVARRHGPFAVLHIESVFFEPPYEIHAYEALGHEALARRDVDPQPGRLEDALRSWRLFLAEGGTRSRFASIARERVSALEREVAEAGAVARPRPERLPVPSLRHLSPGELPGFD